MTLEDHFKLYILILGIVIAAFLMNLFKLSKHTKYKILILSIYLVILEPLQKLHLSYFNASEIVLQILGINILMTNRSVVKKPIYKLFISFIFLVMIASIINNETYVWFRFFLNPLLIFISIKHLVTSEEQHWRLIKSCRNLLLLYGLLFAVSVVFGDVSSGSSYGEYLSRDDSNINILGFGSRESNFHGFEFALSSNMMANLIAIILIISFILYLYSNARKFEKLSYILLIIMGFGLIIFTTGRAALIAALMAFLLILYLSSKRNKLNIFILIIIFSGVVFLYGNEFINQFSNTQFQRLEEMTSKGLNSGNSLYRIDFLKDTVENSLNYFFGVGFNYYYKHQIDDAMLYSFIINGSGLTSLIIFIFWAAYYIKIMVKGIRQNLIGKPILVLGLAVIINVLISSYSQTYLFGWRVYNIIVWTLLATSYNYYIYYNQEIKTITKRNKSKVL